jgi:hypothetical protein
MLSVLSAATIFAPLIGMSFAYLQVANQPKKVMLLQVLAAISVISAINIGGRVSPLGTCFAVAGGAAFCFGVTLFVVGTVEGTPVWRLVIAHVGPLLASAPMVGSVVALRWALDRAGVHVRYVNLFLEVVVGILAYVVSAWLVARSSSRDFVGLARSAFLRRRGAVASQTS